MGRKTRWLHDGPGIDSIIEGVKAMQDEISKASERADDAEKELGEARGKIEALEARIEELEEKLENAPWSFLESTREKEDEDAAG